MPVIITVFLLIWPFGTLPLILYLIYKNKRYAFYFLACFMALYSIFYFPFGDQYRYWFDFNHLFERSTNDLIYLSQDTYRYSLVYPLMFAVKYLHGSVEHLRFFLVFLSYVLCFIMFFDIIDKAPSQSIPKAYPVFLIFFLSIPFFGISGGFRWGTGITFLCCSAYYYFTKQKIKGFILGIVASAFHFACLPLFTLLFAVPFFCVIIKTTPMIILLVLCCSMMIEQIFLIFYPVITQLLPSNFITNKLDPYVLGFWKEGAIADKSDLNIFVTNLCNIIYILFILIFFWMIYRDITRKIALPDFLMKCYGYAVCLGILFFTFHNYATISTRLLSCIILFYSITYILRYIYLNQHSYFWIILTVCFLNFSVSFMAIRKVRRISHESQFLYSNIYQIFFHEYDSYFIEKYVGDDGKLYE